MTNTNILDGDRSVIYQPVATAGPFPVPFPLFDQTGADLAVTLDGEVVEGWSFNGAISPGFYGAPNTWVDGAVTFGAPISGTLRIDGDRAPRRVAQFQEGRGVPARDVNLELNILTAICRELRTRCIRLLQTVGLHGLALAVIDSRLDAHDGTLAAHAATLANHESRLLPIPDVLAARDAAQSWAEQPYGQAVVSDPDGRSALHWQEVAHQWATEAKAWAETVGGMIYDFGLLSEDAVGEEDWGTL